MKRFTCGDVIPGCGRVLTGVDDDSVLTQVISHAARDHGLAKPPSALVELVRAHTATVHAPRPRGHLRVVDDDGLRDPGSSGRPTMTEAFGGAPSELPPDAPIPAPTPRAGEHDRSVTDLTERMAWNHGRGPRLAEGFGVGRIASAHQTYRHEGLLYRGLDEFLALVVPFIRDGLEREQPVLVAVTEPRLQALRSALGGDVASVLFVDMAELGANPARIIPAWREFANGYAVDGRPIRGVGEPIWAGRRDAEVVECQLHEALLNMALSPDTPLWLICPYDLTTLDDGVIEEAHRSHPAIVDAQSYRGSTRYGGTYHVESIFRSTLPEPSTPAVVAVTFDVDRRSSVTRAVLRFAAKAGLPSERTARLAAAMDEVATAGAQEGGGTGLVRLWQDGSAVICEVRDPGVVDDPLIGRAASVRPGRRESALRLANQLCDLVQVRSNVSGTTVRAHSWL